MGQGIWRGYQPSFILYTHLTLGTLIPLRRAQHNPQWTGQWQFCLFCLIVIATFHIEPQYFELARHCRGRIHTEHNLTTRGANPVDIESVTFNSYLVLVLAIVAALVVTTAITFLSRNLELLVLDYIRDMPWNVVFIGIGCVLLLAVYLYWLGARRKTKDYWLGARRKTKDQSSG